MGSCAYRFSFWMLYFGLIIGWSGQQIVGARPPEPEQSGWGWGSLLPSMPTVPLEVKIDEGSVKKAANTLVESVVDQVDQQFSPQGKGAKTIEGVATRFTDSVLDSVEHRFREENSTRARTALSNVGKVASKSLFGAAREELEKGEGKRAFEELSKNTTGLVKDVGTELEYQVVKTGAYAVHYTDEMGKKTEEHAKNVINNVKELKSEVLNELPIYTFAVVIAGTSAYYGSKVCWDWVHRTIKRPRLIIKSSYRNPIQRVIDYLFARKGERIPMVYDEELATRLATIERATKNINIKINGGKQNVSYRNLMIYGPPGTGKTRFAEQLAEASGMEFVTMSGASFSKFKKGEGIVAMDALFAWANRSKGLMIFIDEADSFLSNREDMKPNSEKYQILNNFLNYTGNRSTKFMLVFATNHLEKLDSAVWRRIDDLVEMPLPKGPERERVLKLYRERILLDIPQNGIVFVLSVRKILNDQKIKEIAEQTEGLSNGDLESIINTIKTDADVTESGLVTTELVDLVVERAVAKLQTLTNAAASA